MFKHKLKIFILALGLTTLGACNSGLDINPTDSIDASTALSNKSDVESALIGAYASSGVGSKYGCNFLLLNDLLASERYLSWRGSFQGPRQVATKTMTSINSEATRTWIGAYVAINVANAVLESLDKVADFSKDENKELKVKFQGEALFLRSAMHFELVRLYAQPWVEGSANSGLGVPIMSKYVILENDAAKLVARNTIAEVYAQVIADLKQAETLLPTTNGVRVNKYSAKALLARVYMQQSNYVGALQYANDVINNSGTSLSPSLKAVFSNRNNAATNVETLFEIQQNNQNNAGTANDGLATFYANILNAQAGRGDIDVSAVQRDLYEPTDVRRSELIYSATGPGRSALCSGKWTDPFANIPVIRLAEMYLVRAECNVRLNSTVGATPLSDVNLIRVRSKATPLTSIDVAAVLNEKNLEFAYEGHRINDLKRTKRSTGNFAFDAPRLVMPIPQRELDANKSMVQNTGY